MNSIYSTTDEGKEWMKIHNNIQALNAYRHLNQNEMSKNLKKLSSGLRINRAFNDAAGEVVSKKMHSQIRGLNQAERHALDCIALIQTAEGAVQEINAMLERMRELSVQAASGSISKSDKEQIQIDIDALTDEIDNISENAEFHTKTLSNPAPSGRPGSEVLNLHIQIGADADESINLEIAGIDSNALLESGGVNVESQRKAQAAIAAFDKAIENITTARAKLETVQNRMERTYAELSHENLSSTESGIRDADIVQGMAAFTRNNMINQSATAMLAQDNQRSQGVLQLLQ
ncbi:flagellin [Salibacterium salarium]